MSTYVGIFGKWREVLQIFLLYVLELWFHTLSNRTMRMDLSFPITGPDPMDACMRTIPSIVPSLIHQNCTVSTIHIRTFRQQCNLCQQYTVSAFHSFCSSSFHVEFLLQLEQVVLFDRDSKDRNNPLLETLCCYVYKTQLHWNNQCFSEFVMCKNSQFYSSVPFVESTTWPYFRNF